MSYQKRTQDNKWGNTELANQSSEGLTSNLVQPLLDSSIQTNSSAKSDYKKLKDEIQDTLARLNSQFSKLQTSLHSYLSLFDEESFDPLKNTEDKAKQAKVTSEIEKMSKDIAMLKQRMKALQDLKVDSVQETELKQREQKQMQ
jgi:hypothetical protein